MEARIEDWICASEHSRAECNVADRIDERLDGLDFPDGPDTPKSNIKPRLTPYKNI